MKTNILNLNRTISKPGERETLNPPSQTEQDLALERLKLATELFSTTTFRAMDNIGALQNWITTVERTVPAGIDALTEHNRDMVLLFLRDPSTAKIFKNPDEMWRDNNYLDFADKHTARSIKAATNLMQSASLVFSHSVFDATIFDYCKVCVFWDSMGALPLIKDRKITVDESQTFSKNMIRFNKLDDFLKELERQSILRKADTIHQLTTPGQFHPNFSSGYQFSRDRLKAIDTARHEAIHGLAFSAGAPKLPETLTYLLQTVFYFVSLINQKYDMKLNPNLTTKSEPPAGGTA